MCAVAYLAGTLTERQFFPAVDNMLLFPLLAVMINVVRVRKRSAAPAQPERQATGRPSSLGATVEP
jgi:hypothetical protein